tara:strand:- start:182 stop:526 length:345 start_codon:yes stop_codon:yes gene_type:complete
MFINVHYLNFYIYSAIIYIILFYSYYFITKFRKEIIIKDDFVVGVNKKNIMNVVSDTNNNIYIVDNRYLLFVFDAVETVTKIEKDKKYLITGYGMRIPFLELYENITSVTLLDK